MLTSPGSTVLPDENAGADPIAAIMTASMADMVRFIVFLLSPRFVLSGLTLLDKGRGDFVPAED